MFKFMNNCMIHVFLILDLWMQMEVEAGCGGTQRAGSSLPGTVEEPTQHEEVPQVPVAGEGVYSPPKIYGRQKRPRH